MPGSVRSTLHAVLDGDVIFFGSLDELAAFPDVVRNRLLNIDVLACLCGSDCDYRVQVVRRRNDDRVDVFIL